MRTLLTLLTAALLPALASAQTQSTLGETRNLCRITDGTDIALIDGSGNVMVGDGTGPLTVDGTVTANAGSNLNTSALLTTAAHDNAFGTAGTADAQVRSVQGIASMTPLQVQSNAANVCTETTAAGIRTAVEIIDDWDETDRAKVNIIAGQAGVAGGSGTVSALTQRVVLATDVALPAGTNNIGDVDVLSFPDNEPINVAQKGGSAVAAGPCEREVPLYAQVSQTAGTQIITGTASERIYICAVAVVTATAQNIALVDGTGSVCATSPTGLLGGSTAATGQNYAANGGWVLPFNPGAWAKTSTDADNVCLLQSGAGQVSGVITYVSVPNI